jgi:hypothetical protein
MGILADIYEMGLLAEIYEYRWAIVLASVGTYVARKLRAYLRLRAFKGPRGTGFFALWHSRALLSWESHVKYREVTDKYGVYFLIPTKVSDPQPLEGILTLTPRCRQVLSRVLGPATSSPLLLICGCT